MAKLELEIKFEPALTISVAGEELGIVYFKDIKSFGKFIERLKDAINVLVKESQDKETKSAKIK